MFFFPFSFSFNSVVSVSAVFCVLLQNFSVYWWVSFKMHSFDHSEFLGLVNWMLKNKVVKRSSIFLKLFVCFKFPWHKWSIKLKWNRSKFHLQCISRVPVSLHWASKKSFSTTHVLNCCDFSGPSCEGRKLTLCFYFISEHIIPHAVRMNVVCINAAFTL